MKKSEYYAKKHFIAMFDDDLEGKISTANELGKFGKISKEHEEEICSELKKIEIELLQSVCEEKIKNLIERYRTEIEKESLIEDEET